MKSIGVAEFKTVSTGVTVADIMLKTAEVDIIEAATVCPGKYIIIITGDLSAVKASLEAGKKVGEAQYISSFLLGNPHEDLFDAIYGTVDIKELDALGIIETFDVSTMLIAADNAAKTSNVKLLDIRLARGMCGKSYLMLTGEVAAVTASIERASQIAEKEGMLIDTSVIARPDKKLLPTLF